MTDRSDADLLETIWACERQVWTALERGDARADRAALSPDFLGVYPDGFAGREDHVAQLAAGPSVAPWDMSQPRCRAEEAMSVSSLRQRTPDGWIDVSSQDTPAA